MGEWGAILEALIDSVASELQTLYDQGHFQRLVDRFESTREEVGGDAANAVAAMQIAAQAYSRLGNFSASSDAFLLAAAIYAAQKSPGASVCFRNAFAALQRLSLHAAAEWVALRSFSLPRECGSDVALLRYGVAAALQRGNPHAATCILAAASQYVATRAPALETLLDMAFQPAKYGTVDADIGEAEVTVDARGPKLSIIACSRDDARYAKFIAECERALCSAHFEVIRIADAKSMCEGYNRGTDRATGDLLLYCHDDIEFITNGVHRALINALSDLDVACCVGSSVVDGPTWMCHDATNSQGWMAASDALGERYSIGIIGVPNPQSALAAGDGCFIACRKAVARTLRWDGVTFDSFHLYDIDFCLRARNEGFRVGVVRDLMINHSSQGSFDATWHEHAHRFLQKHDLPSGPAAKNQRLSIPVGTRADAARVARNLLSLVPTDYSQQLLRLLDNSFAAARRECSAVRKMQRAVPERTQ